MALSDEDRALMQKFNDRAASLDRESVEKTAPEKLPNDEKQDRQEVSPTFNDRATSQDTKTPDKQSAITEKFNERVSPDANREKGDTVAPHAPGASKQGGPTFNGPGGDAVRSASFVDRQKQEDRDARGDDADSKDKLAKDDRALMEKFSDSARDVNSLDYRHDRER